MHVGALPTIGNAPFIIASQRGYFAAEGLDVQLVNFSSGAEIVAPLGTGQIDAGSSITLSAGLINAINRGLAVKVVADNGSLRPHRNIANIMVRKDLQAATSPVDLAKLARPIRAAATAEGLLPHAIILLQAEQAGLSITDVNMAFMGLPDMNAALKSGALDIAASGEPLITIAEQQGIATRWKEMAQLYPNMPYSNVLFGPNLLEKDRDTGERLVRGYLRGGPRLRRRVHKEQGPRCDSRLYLGSAEHTCLSFPDAPGQRRPCVYQSGWLDPDRAAYADPGTLDTHQPDPVRV